MKRFYKLFVCWVSVLFLVLSPNMQSHASLKSLLIRTDSNALMTLSLDDLDYAVMPMSGIGTVTNTINSSARIPVNIAYYDDNGASHTEMVWCTYRNGRWYFNHRVPGIIYQFNIALYRNYDALPSVGTYSMSFDLTSDFSYEYSGLQFASQQTANNVATDFKYIDIESDDWEQFSGDLYVSPVTLKLGSVHNMYFRFFVPASQEIQQIAGNFSWRFVNSDEEPMYHIGYDASLQNYQDGVSSSLSGMNSSLSDMSSAMSDQAENIEEVADAIDALRGAMEPHYDNVLTQLHHVTEQLHALWDQQYNLHHVPLMAKLGDIITAIQTMDVNITVDVDGLKSTINTMSTNIQNKLGSVQTALTNKLTSVQTGINNKLQNVQDGINTKLQNVTDHITGGYDNSGINQEASKLDDSLKEYDDAEKNVLENVNDSLNDFEFDSGFDSYSNSIKMFSDFLQSLYEASGGFKVIINLSLMLSIAGMVIGFYRVKEGG